MLMTEFSVSRPMPPNKNLRLPFDKLRPPSEVRIEAFHPSVVKRENAVLHGLDQPEPLQFDQLLRIVLRDVPSLTSITVRVV